MKQTKETKTRILPQYDPWLKALAKSDYPENGFHRNKSSLNETNPHIDQIVTTCQGKKILQEEYSDAVHAMRILLSVFTLHGITYYPKGEEPEGCLPFLTLPAYTHSIAYSLVGLLSLQNLCPSLVTFGSLQLFVKRFMLTMYELGYEFYFTGNCY